MEDEESPEEKTTLETFSAKSKALMTVMYLLVHCFVAMRDLLHWQH